jgi:predicted anti-sigma-YlaC factor YlaD
VKLSEDLTCAELVELVTDYLEGALSERDRERFEEHVVFCGGCSAYLEQMHRTIELTCRLTEDDLSVEAQTSLLTAFRDWRERG